MSNTARGPCDGHEQSHMLYLCSCISILDGGAWFPYLHIAAYHAASVSLREACEYLQPLCGKRLLAKGRAHRGVCRPAGCPHYRRQGLILAAHAESG